MIFVPDHDKNVQLSSAKSLFRTKSDEDEPEYYFHWIQEHFPLLQSGEHQDIVREMDRLVAVASSHQDESPTARDLLGHFVVTRSGAPPGWASHYASRVAGFALLRISYDTDLRDFVFPSVRLALAHCPMLPPDMRLIMLDAFEAFVHDKYWRDTNRHEAGSTLLKALQCEFDRMPIERDERFQVRLLFLMKLVGENDAQPLLDAIADAHQSEEIRSLAKRTARYLLLSLEHVWINTPEDQVSSLVNRAKRLEEAPTLDLNEGEFIQAIFNQMKGAKIVDSTDPRLPWLQKYMDENPESRVALASAFVVALCTSSETSFREIVTAARILAEFAMVCDTPADIGDALLGLRKLRVLSPEIAVVLDEAKQKASEKFVQRSLRDSDQESLL